MGSGRGGRERARGGRVWVGPGCGGPGRGPRAAGAGLAGQAAGRAVGAGPREEAGVCARIGLLWASHVAPPQILGFWYLKSCRIYIIHRSTSSKQNKAQHTSLASILLLRFRARGRMLSALHRLSDSNLRAHHIVRATVKPPCILPSSLLTEILLQPPIQSPYKEF